MCNSRYHSSICECGFGGVGHRGRRGSSSYTGNNFFPEETPSDVLYRRFPELRKTHSVASRFVTPNASCPVCGAGVWYYQNEHGSRVFFDDLGPPWPKHPCTDSQSNCTPVLTREPGLGIEVKSHVTIREIDWFQRKCESSPTKVFAKKHGKKPWPLAHIAKREKSGKKVFLVLEVLQPERTTKAYIACASLPKCCTVGFVVAIGRKGISFFDTATMAPKIVAYKRYRSANGFIEAIIDAGH